MGDVIRLRFHGRASAEASTAGRACIEARASTVTPAALAASVAAIVDHQTDGMTLLLHHFETASAPGSTPSEAKASAIALRVGQSSTTARKVSGRSNIESPIGQIGLSCKANVADDYSGVETDNRLMGNRKTETEQVFAFIARVRAARKARFKTQNPILTLLEIDQGTYKHYEIRTPLPYRYIPKFVAATGVSYEWLLAADGEGPAVEPLPVPKPRKKKVKQRRTA